MITKQSMNNRKVRKVRKVRDTTLEFVWDSKKAAFLHSDYN